MSVTVKGCNKKVVLGLALGTLLAGPAEALAQSIALKELVNVRGVRTNRLVGYGLVFGLAGTGDSAASVTTRKAAATMMTKLGIPTVPEEVAGGNLASVLVTASLPPFSRIGDRIDIRVSANGDAKSLAGGTLLMTPLRAGDGKVYAVAQGPLVVGQADGTGPKVLTVAAVPSGAQVEREFLAKLERQGTLQLSLRDVDFTTARRIVTAINQRFRGFYAEAKDPGTITVTIPESYDDDTVAFIAEMEVIPVQRARPVAVIINERTGTIVLGHDVLITPVTIAHGDLAIKVAGSSGDEAARNESLVRVDGSSVGDLVGVLNRLGVKPADLVGILQAMKAAGALNGEVKFI